MVSIARGGAPGDATSDQQLIARCQDGALEAFRPIVERYGDQVYATIYLMTRDHGLSEDLTQETFVRAWRGLGGFRSGAPLRPWLLRIAANVVISHRRRRWPPFVPLPSAERDRASDDPPPETLIERAETGHALRRALGALPDDQRQAVVLRYYAELSVPEIARATGWREGTVKSRLHRALAQLRAALEE